MKNVTLRYACRAHLESPQALPAHAQKQVPAASAEKKLHAADREEGGNTGEGEDRVDGQCTLKKVDSEGENTFDAEIGEAAVRRAQYAAPYVPLIVPESSAQRLTIPRRFHSVVHGTISQGYRVLQKLSV